MKVFAITVTIFALMACSINQRQLTSLDINRIEEEIIQRSEQHADDLEDMNYESVMTFYSEDHIVFGDGYYWGDYLTIDGVWKNILGEGGWKRILYFKLDNHQVHVFSEDAASYLVEFDHKHLHQNGDTISSSGCFTYGMQKIDGDWKAVTSHVSHIPERTSEDKWWSKYSPWNRDH